MSESNSGSDHNEKLQTPDKYSCSRIQLGYLSKQKKNDNSNTSSSSDEALSISCVKSAKHFKHQKESTTSSSDESSETQGTPIKYKSKYRQQLSPSKKRRRKENSFKKQLTYRETLSRNSQTEPKYLSLKEMDTDVLDEFSRESNCTEQCTSSDENSLQK